MKHGDRTDRIGIAKAEIDCFVVKYNVRKENKYKGSIKDEKYDQTVGIGTRSTVLISGDTCTVPGMLYKGVSVCICSGLKYIQKDFADYHPTIMFVVPLLAEKLYQQIELNVKKQGKEKAYKTGLGICRLFGKVKIDLTDVFFKEIKAAFGGKLKIIMCGGAPLTEELIKSSMESVLICSKATALPSVLH